MRPALLLALLVVLVAATAGGAGAASKPTPSARLTIDVLEDGAEAMRLEFSDLDVNTEYRSICLPMRAALLSVRDGQGDLAHEASNDGERLSLTFRPRTPTVTIEMERAEPTEGTPPLRKASANFCATPDSQVEVVVRAAAPNQLYFASAPGTISNGQARWTSTGPNYVTYAYEAALPQGSGLVVVNVPPFRLFVPEERVEEARAVARVAAPAFRNATEEAGLALPWEPLRVHYAADAEFSWEAGHYGGDGLIAVKPSTLVDDPREGFPYVGAKVLVHEAFHAASAPHGKGEVNDTVAWWLEGTARHAERMVDRELPDARRHCETSGSQIQCWFFDDRISREMLARAYEPGFEFETDWEPSMPQTEETRRFYYAYNEFLVASYVERAGVAAYREAWGEIVRAFADKTRCPCEDGWLEDVLLRAADDLAREDLFRPYADEHATDPAAFEARVGTFLQQKPEVPQPPFFGLPVPAPAAWAALLVVLVVARALRAPAR